jgi:methylenetetrahydrofolate dehydrogenase (NADP+)/methenyltetrahydrofolate cyclohydrolase
MIIKGDKIADKINRATRARVKKIVRRGFVPKIIVFLIGKRPESEIYVRQKKRLAKQLGFDFEIKRFPKTVRQKKLADELSVEQGRPEVCGVLIQLPLPKNIDSAKILSRLSPDTDIDCLSSVSLGRLILRNNLVVPPTAGAILEILKGARVKLTGKKIVVIGSGLLVGKPLVMILMNGKATVTVCNSITPDLGWFCRTADVVISGAGKRNLITAEMVSENAVVIDAGFSFSRGKAHGDVDVEAIDRKGAAVTPTPGGVGPVTVACLMRNAVICAEKKYKLF